MTGNGAKNEQKPAKFRLVWSILGVSIISITKFRFRVLIDLEVSIGKNRLLIFSSSILSIELEYLTTRVGSLSLHLQLS